MGKITAIECIHAREILDSRGNPTIETEITLANGVKGIASVRRVLRLVPLKRLNCATTTNHDILEKVF